MAKRFIKDSVGWGAGLWLVGYALGMVFFAIMPKEMIGWAIMPIGVFITLWVLAKKVKPGEGQANPMLYYFKIGVAWAVIAIVLDYLFLVKLLKPEDGYYKLDVYLYYFLTFAMPLAMGFFKTKKLPGAKAPN